MQADGNVQLGQGSLNSEDEESEGSIELQFAWTQLETDTEL